MCILFPFAWTKVIIYDGSTEEVAHVLTKIGLYRKKIGFDDSFDVNKCFQQIDKAYLLHICAQCSELPSNISIMASTYSFRASRYFGLKMNYLLVCLNTVWPRSLAHFYKAAGFLKMDKTFWTPSEHLRLHFSRMKHHFLNISLLYVNVFKSFFERKVIIDTYWLYFFWKYRFQKWVNDNKHTIHIYICIIICTMYMNGIILLLQN